MGSNTDAINQLSFMFCGITSSICRFITQKVSNVWVRFSRTQNFAMFEKFVPIEVTTLCTILFIEIWRLLSKQAFLFFFRLSRNYWNKQMSISKTSPLSYRESKDLVFLIRLIVFLAQNTSFDSTVPDFPLNSANMFKRADIYIRVSRNKVFVMLHNSFLFVHPVLSPLQLNSWTFRELKWNSDHPNGIVTRRGVSLSNRLFRYRPVTI